MTKPTHMIERLILPVSDFEHWTRSRGDAADHFHRQLGWTPAGALPGYALDPDGTPHDAVIFYKALQQANESRAG
jgi:hypothetical protein